MAELVKATLDSTASDAQQLLAMAVSNGGTAHFKLQKITIATSAAGELASLIESWVTSDSRQVLKSCGEIHVAQLSLVWLTFCKCRYQLS